MLDFYLLPQRTSGEDDAFKRIRTATPSELKSRHLGSIDLRPFHSLDTVWSQARANGIHLSYFDDFSLSSDQVAALQRLIVASLPTLQQSHEARMAAEIMAGIVMRAEAVAAGLIAICD